MVYFLAKSASQREVSDRVGEEVNWKVEVCSENEVGEGVWKAVNALAESVTYEVLNK